MLAERLVGPQGRIFAFEPSDLAADVIQDAIDTNKLENIQLTRAAVGNQKGEVDLLIPIEAIEHSPSIFGDSANSTRVRVPMISLDQFTPLLDGVPIDLIKIDAEGSEPDVIEGMKDLVSAGLVKNMFCELNSGWLRRNDSTPDKLRARIRDMGFEIFRETVVQTGLETPDGPQFSIQDIWCHWPGS